VNCCRYVEVVSCVQGVVSNAGFKKPGFLKKPNPVGFIGFGGFIGFFGEAGKNR